MPVLYDACLKISISFLKRHGYLNPDQCKSGTITWSVGEGEDKQITGRIGISINTHSQPYLELDYKFKDTPINYRVQLFSMPANIRKGVVWFFICPHTGKRCRKLYLVSGKFLHREAFRGMYKKQTYSKRWRNENKIWDSMFSREDILTELDKPYFKETYKGKPTKRYIRLLKKAKQVKQISVTDLLR